jgi:uncharacterized membrane protein
MAYADEVPGRETSSEVSVGRVLALSDGVFAIAMTLLVLDLGIGTNVATDDVAEALHKQTPELVAYGLSFVVISLYWLSHQRLHSSLRSVDHGLAVLNLFELGLIALLPFPTEVLGEHGSATAAVVAYAAMIVVLSSVSTVQWFYASRHHLFAPQTPDVYITHAIWRGATLAVVFGISIPVAFASTVWAQWTWVLFVPARMLLTRRFGKIHQQGHNGPPAVSG